jgi:hypothetical protein
MLAFDKGKNRILQMISGCNLRLHFLSLFLAARLSALCLPLPEWLSPWRKSLWMIRRIMTASDRLPSDRVQ